MKINVTPESSYGTITEFDTFDLEFIQRNKFVEPSDLYDITTSIPKSNGTSNSSISSVRLSPRFTDSAFTTFSLNPPEGSNKPRHGYDNTTIYNNMQRLCYEVLEPLVGIVDEMPTINSGLLFTSNTSGFDQDSFYSDQVKGNAVVISFPDDPTNTKIVEAFDFISEFSLFDRLIYDSTQTPPTLSVSVNEKKRKIKSITD